MGNLGAAAGQRFRSRGAELGFTFNLDKRSRIYNTFDAHRLLHWADEARVTHGEVLDFPRPAAAAG